MEGGVEDLFLEPGKTIKDRCDSTPQPPNCIDAVDPEGVTLEYDYVWRDNGATSGIYALLDLRSCKQSPGDTFTFEFSGDFVEPDNPSDVVFGFEKLEYKITFV